MFCLSMLPSYMKKYIYILKKHMGCVGLPVCIAYNISVNPVEMLRCWEGFTRMCPRSSVATLWSQCVKQMWTTAVARSKTTRSSWLTTKTNASRGPLGVKITLSRKKPKLALLEEDGSETNIRDELELFLSTNHLPALFLTGTTAFKRFGLLISLKERVIETFTTFHHMASRVQPPKQSAKRVINGRKQQGKKHPTIIECKKKKKKRM